MQKRNGTRYRNTECNAKTTSTTRSIKSDVEDDDDDDDDDEKKRSSSDDDDKEEKRVKEGRGRFERSDNEIITGRITLAITIDRNAVQNSVVLRWYDWALDLIAEEIKASRVSTRCVVDTLTTNNNETNLDLLGSRLTTRNTEGYVRPSVYVHPYTCYFHPISCGYHPLRLGIYRWRVLPTYQVGGREHRFYRCRAGVFSEVNKRNVWELLRG